MKKQCFIFVVLYISCVAISFDVLAIDTDEDTYQLNTIGSDSTKTQILACVQNEKADLGDALKKAGWMCVDIGPGLFNQINAFFGSNSRIPSAKEQWQMYKDGTFFSSLLEWNGYKDGDSFFQNTLNIVSANTVGAFNTCSNIGTNNLERVEHPIQTTVNFVSTVSSTACQIGSAVLVPVRGALNILGFNVAYPTNEEWAASYVTVASILLPWAKANVGKLANATTQIEAGTSMAVGQARVAAQEIAKTARQISDDVMNNFSDRYPPLCLETSGSGGAAAAGDRICVITNESPNLSEPLYARDVEGGARIPTRNTGQSVVNRWSLPDKESRFGKGVSDWKNRRATVTLLKNPEFQTEIQGSTIRVRKINGSVVEGEFSHIEGDKMFLREYRGSTNFKTVSLDRIQNIDVRFVPQRILEDFGSEAGEGATYYITSKTADVRQLIADGKPIPRTMKLEATYLGEDEFNVSLKIAGKEQLVKKLDIAPQIELVLPPIVEGNEFLVIAENGVLTWGKVENVSGQTASLRLTHNLTGSDNGVLQGNVINTNVSEIRRVNLRFWDEVYGHRTNYFERIGEFDDLRHDFFAERGPQYRTYSWGNRGYGNNYQLYTSDFLRLAERDVFRSSYVSSDTRLAFYERAFAYENTNHMSYLNGGIYPSAFQNALKSGPPTELKGLFPDSGFNFYYAVRKAFESIGKESPI